MNNNYETERLILRPIGEEDAEFLYELMNEESWIQNIGDRNIKTVESALEYIRSKHFSQWKNHNCGSYVIIEKSTNAKLGISGFMKRESLDNIDMGFAYLQAHHKKGYGYEAGKKILLVAKDNGFVEPLAIVDNDNLDSINLIKKLGGVFVKFIKFPGEDQEISLFKFQ